MNSFEELIDRWRHHHLDVSNPLHGMKLQEFNVNDDEPGYLQHYFRFEDKEGHEEEFVVRFVSGFGTPIYSCTLRRRLDEKEYLALSEGTWSLAIRHLMRVGESLAATDRDAKGRIAGRSSKDASVERLVEQGHSYLEQQRLEDAIRSYSAALELEPDRAALYFHRGLAWSHKYHNQGENVDDLQRSIDDYTRLIKINPKSGPAFFQRAGLWSQQGSAARAIADYEAAIQNGYLVSHSYYCSGVAWQSIGDYGKAILDFDAAINTGGESDQFIALMSRGEARHKIGRFELAIADFTSAAAHNPQTPGVYVGRATALRELGREHEAIADLDLALALAPTFAKAYKERGICRSRLGQHDLARQDFDRAAQFAHQDDF